VSLGGLAGLIENDGRMVELVRRDCIVRIAKRGGAMTGKSDDYTALVQEAKHGEGESQDVEHCGECHSNSVDYDEALDASPVSSRQWIIVAICGMGNATDAVEVLSMSYVLPVIELSTSEKGILSSAVFAGMLAGAVVAGFCADRYGRKPILLASMLVNAACTLGFALSSHIVALAALRFLTGCGVGGAVPVVFSLASEVFDSPSFSRRSTASACPTKINLSHTCAAAACSHPCRLASLPAIQLR